MIEQLGNSELFSDLDITALADISSFSTLLELEVGEDLMNENASGNNLYLLCSGNVEVLSSRTGGTSSEVVLSNKDNELFGELSWIQGQGQSVRTATVRCVSEVEVIEVDGTALLRYLENNTQVGFIVMRRIAKVLANRMTHSDVLLKQLLWNS